VPRFVSRKIRGARRFSILPGADVGVMDGVERTVHRAAQLQLKELVVLIPTAQASATQCH
jgi:hypothetical protein